MTTAALRFFLCLFAGLCLVSAQPAGELPAKKKPAEISCQAAAPFIAIQRGDSSCKAPFSSDSCFFACIAAALPLLIPHVFPADCRLSFRRMNPFSRFSRGTFF